jgi:hypothetical protein
LLADAMLGDLENAGRIEEILCYAMRCGSKKWHCFGEGWKLEEESVGMQSLSLGLGEEGCFL